MKCPVCRKEMVWNYIAKNWECPKFRPGSRSKGCGYVLKQRTLGGTK